METPSSPGEPQCWREEKTGLPTIRPVKLGLRRFRLYAGLATLFLLLAAIGAMLSFLRPASSPYFLPCVVADYQNRAIPSLPMAQRDLESLSAGGYFATGQNTASQEKSRIVEELADLKSLGGNDSVVVYFSAHSMLADEAKIHILPAGASPDDPDTWISLRLLLEKLRACPARHQLLVLDIMKPQRLPRLGQLYQDVAGALAAELEAVPDPRRLVLTACAPGQVALESEELGRSVFSYYFEEALRGYAKGYAADGRPTEQITVRDLAGFVRARVDRWALMNRNVRQTPQLHGAGGDFPLITLDHGQPRDHLPVAQPQKYPEALLQAWQLRDAFWSDGSYRYAPHVFQEVQAALMEAERNWASGSGKSLEDQAITAARAAQSQFNRERIAFPLQAVSLAQEEYAGRKIDGSVQKALHDLMDNLHKQLAQSKAEDAEKIKIKLREEFQERFKVQTGPDLDSAVFAWAVADPRHDPGTLRFLDDLLRRPGQSEPRYLETLLLRQLADLAYRIESKDWPAPLVGRILSLAQTGERAAADPVTIPWTTRLLEEAARERHDAEISLWARGYASLEAVEKLVKSAEKHYQEAITQAGLIRQAQATLDEAQALLPFYVHFMDGYSSRDKHLEQAVRAARDLAEALLSAPAIKKVKNADLAMSAQEKILNVVRLNRLLAESIHELTKPFSRDNIALEERAGLRTEADRLVYLESLLNVPALNLKAAERAALWTQARAIARQLNEDTMRLDREDDQKGITAPLPFLADNFHLTETVRAHRRAQALLELFELGGVAAERLQPARELLTGMDLGKPGAWCALEKVTRQLWGEQVPKQYRQETTPERRVRLAWIAAPLVNLKAGEETELTASTKIRLKQARDHWTWLGDHHRYLARDYQVLGLAGAGPRAAANFYARAAGMNQDIARREPEFYVAIQALDPVARLMSSQECVPGLLEIQRVLPAGAFGALDMTLTLPDNAWLQVTPDSVRLPELPEASQARQLTSNVPIVIKLKPGAEHSLVSRPLGMMATAHWEGRDFHTLIPVAVYAKPKELQIFVSADPDKAQAAMDEILLRPNKVRQPYYVYLKNLVPRTRNVTVEVLMGASLVHKAQIALKPDDTQRVNLGDVPVPLTGLPKVTGPLVLRVTDAQTTRLLDQKQYRLDIAAPRDYVRVTDIRFDPGSQTGKNKLSVKLQARSVLPGPPISTELVLPRQRIPGYMGLEGGTFQRDLAMGEQAAPVTLFAEDVRFADSASGAGPVYLHVDGLERTFLFQNFFARQGPALMPDLDFRPQVRWNVPAFVRSDLNVRFPLEVDNAPKGASLEVSLGQGSPEHFEPDLVERFSQPKQQNIGFWPQDKDGALIFEAGVRDWQVTWNTLHCFGRRVLRARLLDAQGKELARSAQYVNIDNDPPALVRLLDVPARIKRGSPLLLRAQGKDPESGIAQVVFFVGNPHEDKIPDNTPTFSATPIDAGKTTWAANLQLPDDKKGLTAITAQFTNGVGLVSYQTTILELTETDPPMPIPPPLPNTGTIRGQVLEGPRIQTGLDVILRDPKGNEIKRVKTRIDGSFVFEDVPPGNYLIFCVKPDSLRRATVPARVEQNKTTDLQVELAL